ncbi:DUF1871 family protein [Alkalibacillus haloalkaliphilus]|uniref:DUF1871 family protein n=1 Tax=Alkalibacillus haloalkaliphilus TaxID=94136 RepID=UPI0029365E8E|nr:DUF1871 family protein [Alkalibacillus haloalkaliphilus]MDV2581587.1 DUF1871 family protein [Alkalibacillus haloalkaliphilus]
MKKNIANQIVEKNINAWDPMGLIAGGAPLDEFSVESKRIVEELPHIDSSSELAVKIKKVFDKAFDEDFNYEACLNISQKIWEDFLEEGYRLG